MKIKTALVVVLFLLAITASFQQRNIDASSQADSVTGPIDNKAVAASKEMSRDESKSDDRSSFAKTVKGLEEGWDNLGIGETYYRAGQYERAAQAFKKAYEVDPRNRVLSGKKLIGAYEKLARYDEALEIVDDIFKNHHLAEIGIKRFEAIRARLLAAKGQSSSSTT